MAVFWDLLLFLRRVNHQLMKNTEGLLCDFVSFALGLLVFPNIGNDVCKYIYIYRRRFGRITTAVGLGFMDSFVSPLHQADTLYNSAC